MRFGAKKSLERWLELERQNAEPRQAERELAALMKKLPQAPVPTAFADTVLSRAGVAVSRQRSWRPSSLLAASRLALALSLILAAATTALAPALVWPLVLQIKPGLVLALGADFLVTGTQLMGEGLAVWNVFASVSESLIEFTSSPRLLSAVVASLLLSTCAFYLLRGLMAGDRRIDYVETA